MIKKSRLETILLAFLVLLSFMQIFKLWFEDFSGRNFFYNVILNGEDNIESINEGEEYIVKPYKISTFDSGEIKYLNTNLNKYIEIFDEGKIVIRESLQKGNYEGKEAFDYRKLLENEGLMFDYNVRVPISAFIYELSIVPKEFHSKIDKFNKIAIIFSKSSEKEAKVYFIDDVENKTDVMTIEIDNVLLKTAIRELKEIEYDLYKIGSDKIFKKIAFIPTIKNGDSIIYRETEFVNNIETEEDIRSFIKVYFENVITTWIDEKNENEKIYGDNKIAVKYFDDGRVEYNSQELSKIGNMLSFEESYAIARKFIAKNIDKIHKEYYLTKYTYSKTDGYRFYFDYAVYGKKIYKIGDKYDSDIEVRVYKDIVKEFKVTIKNLKVDQAVKKVELKSYIEALDNLREELKEDFEVKNMEIGYHLKEGKLTLKWIIYTDVEEFPFYIDAVRGL